MENGTVDPAILNLDVSIEKAGNALARMLKGGRKVVSAVIFKNGKMEEIHSAQTEDDGNGKILHHPFRSQDVKPIIPEKTEPTEPIKPQPVAATAVAVPTLGCPEPDFDPAELRARRVLSVFLNEEQREDFRKHNQFVTVGVGTGHRYMVTSRHNRQALDTYRRTLYDLDDGVAICCHDHDVPPAEEMLALHVLLQTGHEDYLRRLE